MENGKISLDKTDNRYDKAKIPPTKFASQCLDEFDNFMVKQEDFNAYFGR